MGKGHVPLPAGPTRLAKRGSAPGDARGVRCCGMLKSVCCVLYVCNIVYVCRLWLYLPICWIASIVHCRGTSVVCYEDGFNGQNLTPVRPESETNCWSTRQEVQNLPFRQRPLGLLQQCTRRGVRLQAVC